MSENTSEQRDGSGAGSKLVAFAYAAGGLVIYFIALFTYYQTKVTAIVAEPKWQVAALFFLPVLAQIVGAAYHVERSDGEHRYFYKFSMWVSFASTTICCFFWVVYSFDHMFNAVLSSLALVIIGLLICLVVVIMCAFMQEPNKTYWPRLSAIREGSANEPLWALLFLFFVIFLNVTYLFGFAFAFHDRQSLKDTANKAPALRMANNDSPDTVDLSPIMTVANNGASNQEGAKAHGGATGSSRPKVSPADGEDISFYFFFKSGEAQLELDKNINYIQCDLPIPSTASTSQSEQTSATPTPTPVKPPQRAKWLTSWFMGDPLFQQQFNLQFNRCSLERLKLRIEQETRNGAQARVILIGQGDNDPVANLQHYKSNYELSEARVQTIRYKITEALKNESDSAAWHNLEWLTLPSSDENLADDVLKKIFDDQKKLSSKKNELIYMNKRIVSASIVPIQGDIASLQMQQHKRTLFKELNLMDYMYFSIYTITTTGYGDIIPTTAYAKFVISIANICEVLFLVVFFNALVSIRGDKRKDPNEDKKKKQDEDEKQRSKSILDLPSD